VTPDRFPHVVNVIDRGATGNGSTDDTLAIQGAIDHVVQLSRTGRPGVVLLPPGTYLVTSSLTMSGGVGISICGMGQQASSLRPSSALAGLPVLKLTDCVNCSILMLWIQGDGGAPPSAGIESHVSQPDPSFPANLLIRDVIIGTPPPDVPSQAGLQYGVRFTADPGWDGDNAHSTMSLATIRGLTAAAISIEHSQSLVHKFDALRIEQAPIGIQTHGGSFQLDNSFLGVSDVEFDFVDPDPGDNLEGRDTHGYFHPILISNTTSEGPSDMLRTSWWPAPGTPRTDGITGIHVFFSNFGQKGTGPAPDRSILYQSPGQLSITNSHLDFGTDTNIVLPNPKSSVTLAGNYISTVHEVQFAGHLTSIGNLWRGGASQLVPASGAVQNVFGDWIDFPGGTN
jgi:Pectate lyase superfamily protein